MSGRVLQNINYNRSFINLLKGSQSQTGPAGFPAILDVNGFPTTDPGSLSPGTTAIGWSVPVPTVMQGDAVTQFTVSFSGTGAIQFSCAASVVSNSNATITGNLSTNFVITGTNVRVVFTVPGGFSTSIGGSFPVGKTYSGMSNAVLCRTASDETAISGGAIYTPEFLSYVTALKPSSLRFLDWNDINHSLVSDFNHNTPLAAFSYVNERFQPECYGGTTTGTNAAALTAPSGFTSLVHGATVQGRWLSTSTASLSVSGSASGTGGVIRLTVSDTSALSNGRRVNYNPGFNDAFDFFLIDVIDATHIELRGSTYVSNTTGTVGWLTLAVGVSAATIAVATNLAPINSTASSYFTAIYDSYMDCWIVRSQGLLTGPSIDAEISLCNSVGADMWTQLPAFYTDAAVTAHAAHVRDNLSSSLTARYEWSNETWNPSFTAFNYCLLYGKKLGFPLTTANYSFHSLRVRQVMGLITSAYTNAGKTNYLRIMATQNGASPTNNKTYRFNGGDLLASHAAYLAYVGGIDPGYNSAPNRAIDYCDRIAVAPYWYGDQVYQADTDYTSAGQIVDLLTAADNYNGGSTDTALSWMDTSLRMASTSLTLATLTTTMGGWNTAAASYDAERAGRGQAKLLMDYYEGGFSCAAPSSARCTSPLGIDTAYSTKIAALIEAYKNDFRMYSLTRDYLKAFEALSNSGHFAWYGLQGVSKWSMWPLADNPTGAYQSWFAVKDYNNRLRSMLVRT